MLLKIIGAATQLTASAVTNSVRGDKINSAKADIAKMGQRKGVVTKVHGKSWTNNLKDKFTGKPESHFG